MKVEIPDEAIASVPSKYIMLVVKNLGRGIYRVEESEIACVYYGWIMDVSAKKVANTLTQLRKAKQ